MNTRLIKTVLLSISLLVVVTACKKIEDVPQQFMRGGNSLILNGDNLIIAGYNSSSTKGYEATLISAKASNGDTNWKKTYGGTYSEAFFSVAKSKAGGYIASGFSNRVSAGSPSMFVVITDAAGKELYSLSYGGTSNYSQGFSVLPNADSGYLVAGYIQKSGSYDRDIYLVRINDVGKVIWEKSIGAKSSDPYASVNEAAYGVITAPGGGYFLTGSVNGGYNSGGGKIFLMKVSSTGDSLWTKTFGNGFGYSLTLTHPGGIADGGIAISGSILEGTNQDAFLLKTDTTKTGNLFPSWSKIQTFGGSGYEYGASMVETSTGDFAVTGISDDGSGHGSQDVYLIHTDANGILKGDLKYFGGAGDEQGYGLMLMPDNGFSITGLSNTDGSYIFMNRVKDDGTQYWTNPLYIK